MIGEYENTTLEAIAERLHVTKPFIYSYFKSKSDLLAAICAHGIAASLEAIDSVLDMPVSTTERLDVLGCKFVVTVLTSQKHIAIFSREEKNLLPPDFERISNMRREFDRKLTSLLEQGIAEGKFHVSDARLASLEHSALKVAHILRG